MTDDCLVVFCTCPSDTVAAEVATALIEQNLAACVTRIPGAKSWYRWQGHLEKDEEVLLLIKTTRGRFAELEAAVRRLHPYEVPEVIAIAVAAGSAAYLQWVRDSTEA
ncbi:MAG: divalent-cation tolerance protein CutA [Gammaproteobacteria bacterium]|nr:divalent-cation tolerance protein CutA [Gammaproteobacteria bacterium]